MAATGGLLAAYRRVHPRRDLTGELADTEEEQMTTSTDLRAQSEAVVAQALTAHRVEHWIATNSYVCGCKEVTGTPHLTLEQAVAHQAAAVMWALNEWVNR